MTRPSSRRGATSGDVLIFLATVSVGAALLYPAWSARSFRELVAEATADVELLSDAAQSVRSQTGRWPTPAEPGEVPPELAVGSSRDSIFRRTGYTLEWTSWRVVDSIEVVDNDPPPAADDAPPDTVAPALAPIVRSLGAIRVYSGDSALLAELRELHDDGDAFVLDTALVLILPARGPDPFAR